MRTTINLDEALLEEAQRLTGLSERALLVREGLKVLEDVRAALARLLPFGDEARGALPWLEAFVASEEAPPTSRDLVASFQRAAVDALGQLDRR